MNKQKVGYFYSLAGLFLILGLTLTACGADTASTASTTTAPVVATTVAATTAAIPNIAPTLAATTQAATTAAAIPTATPARATLAVSGTTAAVETTAPAATTAVTTTSAPATVATSTSTEPLIFYLKDNALWVARTDGSEKRVLAENVALGLRAGENQVVYFQEVKSGADTVVQLKLLRLNSGATVDATLDSKVFVSIPAAQRDQTSGLYGVSLQRLAYAALSPDGTQVVYTKVNPTASLFETIGGKLHPTELWVANLDPQNPVVRKLAPNDKDFAFRPTWSTDGNRVAFLRTNNFGTGAGFLTALWSVYKDGTKLAFLTGPDLTKDEPKYKAAPAFNLLWVGPQALSYQATNQVTNTLWLHDLTQTSDFSRLLAPDTSRDSVFCPQLRRYVYVKQNQQGESQGVYSVEVDKAGAAPVALDPAALQAYSCEGDTVLYRDGQGQINVQRLNAAGAAAGSKVKIGSGPIGDTKNSFANNPSAAFSPGGKFIAVQLQDFSKATSSFFFYRADGIFILLPGTELKGNSSSFSWLNEQRVALLGDGGQGQPIQLSTVDFGAATPTVKPVDTAKTGLALFS